MVSVGRILSVVVLVVSISVLGRAQPDCQDTSTPAGQRRCIEWLRDHKANRTELNTRAERIENELDTKANTRDLDKKATTEVLATKANKKDLEKVNQALGSETDRFWVLLSALLVFFMQAGFLCLEVGMVRKEFDTLQAAYKLFAWSATYAGYFFSFALMFSASHFGGLIGGHLPFWPANVIYDINNDRGIEFFLFQAAFAATAATIPAGAIAERMSLWSYFLIGLFIALIVYPIFGHWAWGGSLYAVETPDVQGWLKRLGFHDFAGSTVVHSIGGWVALVAAMILGPREGRFRGGAVYVERFSPMSRGYAVLGVFLLWFGWWGFNGGSKLEYSPEIARIILNTNIAGVTAGFTAWAFARWQKKWWGKRAWFHEDGFIPEKTIGGALGGLVAITASCDQAWSLGALLIGLSAGIVHNLFFDFLLRREIDDPVGAVPVHLGCGMWGTVCVAGAHSYIWNLDFWKQLAVQLLGIGVAGIWAVVTAMICLYVLKWLRLLKPPEETRMLNLEG